MEELHPEGLDLEGMDPEGLYPEELDSEQRKTEEGHNCDRLVEMGRNKCDRLQMKER